MENAIIASIKPKHVENIASRKKKLELRKRAPKINTPFTCYIYESMDKKYENIGVHFAIPGVEDFLHHPGFVIGEFTCDEIVPIPYNEDEIFWWHWIGNDKFGVADFCLTWEEINDYLGKKSGAALHISDLIIYSKPKPLSDFGLTRAPQSWQYVKTT